MFKKLLTTLLVCLLPLNAHAASTDTCYDSSDTVLMLHADHVDGKATHTLTENGDAQIDTAQSKFGGASGYFDGTGDYVSVPDSADWDLGSSDFTIDFWLRLNDDTNNSSIISQWDSSSNKGWVITDKQNTAELRFQWTNDGSTNEQFDEACTIGTATWYHVAVVRSGNNLYHFLDGTLLATNDVTGETFYNSTEDLAIGALNPSSGGSNYFNGWIDELRVVKGEAVWTSDFTPPTSAYTADDVTDDTKLLMHFDGADATTDFYDYSVPDFSNSIHPLVFNADAQIDTAQSKFGGASLLLDGTGDYVSVPDIVDGFDFGSGDFTIEYWGRTGSTTYMGMIARDPTNVFVPWMLGYTGTGIHRTSGSINGTSWTGGWQGKDMGDKATNTWMHMVLVRSGNTFYTFQDGVQEDTWTMTSAIPSSTLALSIGQWRALNYFNGWIDELRIVKGKAIWTGAFTPPSAAYTECANRRIIST